eukprot:GHVR01179985.1.p1 GENE.GHVR01179985.1~~GHVR01179985.1.p1  ORF type:complete len:352 (+),score=81.27 GHVR01179985.1:59-1114(+)
MCVKTDAIETSKTKGNECDECILRSNDERWVMLPIKYPAIWDLYKKIETTFWTAEDINFSLDTNDYSEMSEVQLQALRRLTLFTAIANGTVYPRNDDITCGLLTDIQVPEARAYYSFQVAMETIHLEVLWLAAEAACSSMTTQEQLDYFKSAVLSEPCVQAKKDYAHTHLSTDNSFSTRIVALACIKKIFSATGRVLLHAMSAQPLLPALSKTYRQVGRDMLLYSECSCVLHNMMSASRIDNETVTRLVTEAVAIEKKFAVEVVNVECFGFELQQFESVIEYVGDTLLDSLGCSLHYKAMCPKVFESIEDTRNTGQTKAEVRRQNAEGDTRVHTQAPVSPTKPVDTSSADF